MRKRTHVALVLDTSGSMDAMRDQAIELFNGQRAQIEAGARNGAGDTRVSLVLFGVGGGTVQVVHDHQDPAAVAPLDRGTYIPQGSTPMRDGIGRAIGILESHDDGAADTAMLVVVVTDGCENSSQEWTAARLSAKIKELQATGRWTFGLYGSDRTDLENLKDTAGLAAVPAANFATYTPTAAGMTANTVRSAGHIATYMANRAMGLTSSVSYTNDEDASVS